MTSSPVRTEPEEFRRAVDSMHAAQIRAEIVVGSIRPPQRLAPYSHALGAEVKTLDVDVDEVPTDSEGSAFGRLILLHDPDGQDAWNGTMRLVAFVQAEVEAALAADPLLPEVAWSWLADALDNEPLKSRRTALGGTVTSTTSVRYGDISGPPRAHQLEMRASWTAIDDDLSAHVEAFCDVLAAAAGLPPTGVTSLGIQRS